jgi:hypothetical protein
MALGSHNPRFTMPQWVVGGKILKNSRPPSTHPHFLRTVGGHFKASIGWAAWAEVGCGRNDQGGSVYMAQNGERKSFFSDTRHTEHRLSTLPDASEGVK